MTAVFNCGCSDLGRKSLSLSPSQHVRLTYGHKSALGFVPSLKMALENPLFIDVKTSSYRGFPSQLWLIAEGYLHLSGNSCFLLLHPCISCIMPSKTTGFKKNPHEPVCFTHTWGLWGWWNPHCWYIPPCLIPLKTLRSHRFLNTPASACPSPTNSITYVIHLQPPPVLSDVQSPAQFSETSPKKINLRRKRSRNTAILG